MTDTGKKNTGKRAYQKPAIVFAKKIEVIAVQCNSAWGIGGGCKLNSPCVRTKN